MSDLITELRRLYDAEGKHSHYQSIPEFVAADTGYVEELNDDWRSDKTRYRFIREWLAESLPDTLIDIGANTGYFSLSIGHDFPSTAVTACERNPVHCEFMDRVIRHYSMPNVLVLRAEASLDGIAGLPSSDVMLHLNVLHHAGHDFDRGKVGSVGDFGRYAQRYLRDLRDVARTLIFQMGYNWGGDKANPIVASEDQAGKVRFTREMLESGGWEVDGVAVAFKEAEDAVPDYRTIDRRLWAEDPTEVLRAYLAGSSFARIWSEFYRRPLMICRRR